MVIGDGVDEEIIKGMGFVEVEEDAETVMVEGGGEVEIVLAVGIVERPMVGETLGASGQIVGENVEPEGEVEEDHLISSGIFPPAPMSPSSLLIFLLQARELDRHTTTIC